MRIDFIQKAYQQDQSSDSPIFNGISIGFQTSLENIGHIRGEFSVTGKRFEEWVKSKEPAQKLAEKMISECLKLDTVELNSYDFETAKRENDSRDQKLKDLEQQNLELALMLSNGGAA